MAFNLFSAITSGMNAYNALSNTQTGQNMIGQAKQAIAPVTQPIQQAFNPAIQTAKSAIAPATNIMSSIAKPVVESTVFNKKTQDYYAPFKSEIEKIGITYDDLAELPEEEKQQVVSQLKQIGVQIPGLAEQEQAKAQEQAIQGEDLGVMGNINEALAGGVRVGEQIPRYAGNLLNLTQKYVTSPLISGGAEMLGADEFANKWRTASTQFGEGAKALGEEITRAGEGNITEKQRTARRVGANIVATAPIPVKGLGLIKGTGILPTIGRGALAGAEATPISIGLEEGRLPTMGEQAIGTVGGAVLGTVAEKLAIPGIQKGIEAVQKKINPSKFTKQIDDETINLVRKAVRPSITGVDSVGKFDIQDEKLLQGVKEVVKQGKKPKNSRELMESISDTKKSIWSEVEKSNKSVIKTTNGSEISTKIKGIVNDPEYDELFANNPSLEAELLRFADDVVTNKRFQNLSQEKLQNYLVDINGRIPQTAFQKSLASNPTQTAKDTLIAKVYKDILDDNLEVAVGMAGKETRQAYGAVRQLEKDFAKRYGVYLRQNPQGLADMFGMEGFADMAVGLLTSSPSQVVRGGIIQGVKKLIKAQNNPDTIIRDIFNLQGKIKNVKTPIVKKPQKLLPPPSKEAIIAESKKGLNKDIKRPLSITPEQAQLAKQAQRQKELTQIEKDIDTNILQSKYNPNKPVAVKEFIDRNITQGKITREEAIPMVENLYEKANGFDKPHYEKMLNDLYSNKKIESFDDLLNEKQVAKEVKTPRQEFLETPEGIYKEINKKANDRRYNPEKANALIAKFKEKTGIDLMKDPLQKFDEKGNVIRVNPNSKPNAKQPRNIVKQSTKSDSDIPEGYFKNAFGEIVKNPSNKNGGFIRNPFAKIEPKRLFAGENSAQPPKSKTGWFKGADGKMRFEIDDSGARVYDNINTDLLIKADRRSKGNTIPQEIGLSDLLNHDDLFTQYPSLKKIGVSFSKEADKNGSFFSNTDSIELSGKLLDDMILNGDKESIKSTLLHEIQHAIQNKEGFARGGNVDDFIDISKNFGDRYEPRLKELEKIPENQLTGKEKMELVNLQIARDKVFKAIDDGLSDPYDQYQKLAGEVEARNVQSRMNLTAKERTLKSPESTEDVPRAKQIIRMDSKGPSMSIKVPEKKIVKPNIDNALIEEARKYKSAEEFVKDNSLKGDRITNNDNLYQKGGYDGVLNIVEDADSVNLTLIELKEKGTGKGTEIIKNLKQYADGKNKKLKIINSSNDKYWDSFKFFERGADGRYVYSPNSKPFLIEGRRGLDYKTPKEMIGKEVSYDGKNYEIINFLYSDESGTLYYKIKGSDGNKIVTPDKLSKKIEGIVQKDKEIVPEIIKPKKILGKKISKADEEHLFKKKNTRK